MKMGLQQSSNNWENQSRELSNKVEMFRRSLKETEKYELLTTNEYLPQMALLVEILAEITNTVKEQPQEMA